VPLKVRDFGTVALVGEEETSFALSVINSANIPDIDTAIRRTRGENANVERRPSDFKDLS
jgi:hypothetical protein